MVGQSRLCFFLSQWCTCCAFPSPCVLFRAKCNDLTHGYIVYFVVEVRHVLFAKSKRMMTEFVRCVITPMGGSL